MTRPDSALLHHDWSPPGSRACAHAPVVLLRSAAQHAVKARFRRDIYAAIRQAWHDLAGRQAGKLRTVCDLKNLVSFDLTQFVARRRPRGRGAAIGEHRVAVTHPALERAQVQAQLVAGLLQPAARLRRLANQRYT